MEIDQSINFFNETYPSIKEEDAELTSQIVSIFEKKIDEIRPIIKIMKDNNFYFYHPDLNTDIRTQRGVILGKNRYNNSEIYVFNSTYFLQKVDGYTDEVLGNDQMPLNQFLAMCDHDFALNGINFIKGYLPELINTLKEQNEKKKLFIGKTIQI